MKFLRVENEKEIVDLLKSSGYRLHHNSINEGFAWIIINPITKIFSYGKTDASFFRLRSEGITRGDASLVVNLHSMFKQNRKSL